MSALAAFREDPSRWLLPAGRRLGKELEWDEIAVMAPQMAATMTAYLEQLSVSHRPASVESASLALRHLAAHLLTVDPSCHSVAAISRAHLEGYKLALAARPGTKTRTISTTTIRHNLGQLRTLFERVIDWGWEDAPRRVPIFVGDIPKADEPLPKFLDDPTAAKFMATLAADPDRRRRLLVELLARTGMRAGEFGGIRDDAMYRVGDTWWLKIPVGKLHNDRHVPLHPLLVGLITDYRMWRGPSHDGFLLERDDGRPFDRRTIHRYVQSVAKRAGVGKVHPHQLRHTLATQCLNRGMSLEAIAALLGHRSPRMTLVYARISNENVADQYFKATHVVEADAKSLDAAERRAHAQAKEHRRLLGNGLCTRPEDLDCRFQTICEGCGFFETGPQGSSSRSCAASATTPPHTSTALAPSSTTSSSTLSTPSLVALDNQVLDWLDNARPRPMDHPCNGTSARSRAGILGRAIGTIGDSRSPVKPMVSFVVFWVVN